MLSRLKLFVVHFPSRVTPLYISSVLRWSSHEQTERLGLSTEIDSVWEERGYTNKSEFIRDALRDAVEPPTELSAEALYHLAESREQREDGETVSQADVKNRLDLDD